MTRLPLRWRLTLAFAVAMLVVLGAVGAFVYLRFAAELRESLDRGLRARGAEVAALVERSPDALRRVDSGLETDESVAQVIRADGTVAASTPGIDAAVIDPALLRRGLESAVWADRDGDAVLDESLRLLVTPSSLDGERVAVVVAASRDEDAETLSALLLLGAVGLGAALIVASAVGYVVAGAALRPVEAMRARAADITDEPGRRLPVPAADDELRSLALTLNGMLERLEHAGAREREALDRQRRFVADASHELRTPLSVLKSEIEVALIGDRPARELEAALVSAGEETDRLCRLAEDLLMLAEADERGSQAAGEQIEVRALLEAVAAREGRRDAAADRRITMRAPAGLVVHGDRLQLERALGNLLDNALRHGGGPIDLSARPADGGVVLEVRDHGPGFPAGFEREAFQRFSRGAPGRAEGGAGLGLALVEAIAAGHGGRVTAEEAEPGALVRIVLPA